MALTLNWKTCGTDGHWCNLRTLKLSDLKAAGVYIIWQAGNPNRAVRVGQGVIADRLSDHRNNPEILKYGELRVTWAELQESSRDGVELYLAETLEPLAGEAYPVAHPMPVTLPFDL